MHLLTAGVVAPRRRGQTVEGYHTADSVKYCCFAPVQTRRRSVASPLAQRMLRTCTRDAQQLLHADLQSFNLVFALQGVHALAHDLGCSVSDAARESEAFMRAMPGLKSWQVCPPFENNCQTVFHVFSVPGRTTVMLTITSSRAAEQPLHRRDYLACCLKEMLTIGDHVNHFEAGHRSAGYGCVYQGDTGRF